RGVRLFSGERVNSASARHILGEEACRVLRQLNVRDRQVQSAIDSADAGLMKCLIRAAANKQNSNPGLYCCGKCTVGLWRHLVAGGLDRQDERLRKGVQHLSNVRDGHGGWRRFPFWYTILLLSELEFPAAGAELRYASPELERTVARSTAAPIALRRKSI